MKIRKGFLRKANDGTAKTVTLAVVIGIALMLSVGITIAQQTQGNIVANTYEQQTLATVQDDCPCHNNSGANTLDGGIEICNSISEGIQYISSQGENWYNQQMIHYLIQQIQEHIYGGRHLDCGENGRINLNQGQQGGGYSYQEMSGESVNGQSQVANYETAPGGVPPFFLTWEELQERFTIIESYCNEGGDIPYWWNAPSGDPNAPGGTIDFL